MLATLKKQRNFIKNCYITTDMKPEEREEYQEQMKTAKELAEREENKGKFTWLEDIQQNGG